MKEKEHITQESEEEKGIPESQFNLKTYFMKGFTYFLVIVACIVCYFAFLRIDDIARLAKELPSDIPTGCTVQFRITNCDTQKEVVYERSKGKGF